jgi:hypothetical protein
MSRGGHNWKGTGTVEGSLSLDVVRLARWGYLAGPVSGTLRWGYGDGTTASIGITGGWDAVILEYRVRSPGSDWEDVQQRVPIRWTACRFGGERPWFVCDVQSNGVYCGRQVAKLYAAGRLFACRHCYRLGYAVQRCGPLDRAHHHLARLHRKLGSGYDGPLGPTPIKPKWMRRRTYDSFLQKIEAGVERLDIAFMAGALRLLARLERMEHDRRSRR